eukprot:2694187-Pyramimonas_sp.AAC.1
MASTTFSKPELQQWMKQWVLLQLLQKTRQLPINIPIPSSFFPTQALPRRVLTLCLKGAGQCTSPRAVPPGSAPRFPQ